MDWDIAGKNVLITGGNSGIGKATAAALVAQGANVTITSRDAGKGAEAAADLEKTAGARVAVGSLDLSRLDSVRSFVTTFGQHHDRLDVLVNNAGVLAGARRETADGFEWTFGVNHLGPFLLTNLLASRLGVPARIINVSSDAHRSAKRGLNFDDLQMRSGYRSFTAYAASKLANILFTVELARRWARNGLEAHAVHPGVVATGFGRGSESSAVAGIFTRLIGPFVRTPEEGAATNVFLATAARDEISAGLYWFDSAPARPVPAATDPDAAARLWEVSEELVGLG